MSSRTVRTVRPSRAKDSAPRVADRRLALLQAAINLFSEHPYEAISVDDICRKAGVAHGLLSYHFGGKRGLFVSAVEHGWDDLVAYEKPADEELTVTERIRGYLRRHLEYARANPRRFTFLLSSGQTDHEVGVVLRVARQDA